MYSNKLNKLNKSILSIIYNNNNIKFNKNQSYTTSTSIPKLNNIVPPTTTIINQKIIFNNNNNNNENIINNNINKIIPSTSTTTNTILPIPVLIGKLVTLRPLKREDRDSLVEAAKDGELYNFKLTIVPSESTIDKYLDVALAPNNSMMPFVILDNKTNRVIGTTRYWKVDVNHRKLEIGHTWINKSYQRSGVNTECKYLLLKYAFEDLDSIRVQFTTDQLNEKSRDAILRIGAKLEGIVRHERIMPDGRIRNSLRFSIINTEWNDVKSNLEYMINKNY